MQLFDNVPAPAADKPAVSSMTKAQCAEEIYASTQEYGTPKELVQTFKLPELRTAVQRLRGDTTDEEPETPETRAIARTRREGPGGAPKRIREQHAHVQSVVMTDNDTGIHVRVFYPDTQQGRAYAHEQVAVVMQAIPAGE